MEETYTDAEVTEVERHARLRALTEVHEFYEFDAVDDAHFDSWLHERIKEVRRQLGIGNPAPTTTESATSPSPEASGRVDQSA